ncbi:MAG TPA: hypothetical protein VIJ28_03950 [Chloroflexota bacterium]
MVLLDLATLGAMGIVPSWPGEEIMPPQPMLAQTRTVLDAWLIERGAGHAQSGSGCPS